jgi:hypothetical protein
MAPEPTVAAYGPDSIAWFQQQPATQSLESAGFAPIRPFERSGEASRDDHQSGQPHRQSVTVGIPFPSMLFEKEDNSS